MTLPNYNNASTPPLTVNTANFWQNRYDMGETQWDIGQVSPPLKAYFDQLTDKTLKILIAGAGNAYEAGYLHEQGFKNVYVVDFAQAPLENFAQKYPDFPQAHLIQADFFTLDMPQAFDLIIEQTFLCAIDPTRRSEYAKQMQRLLKPTGKLVGVLFDTEFAQNPPFGGSLSEYQTLFEKDFVIKKLERCHNSIAPRQDSELFVMLASK